MTDGVHVIPAVDVWAVFPKTARDPETVKRVHAWQFHPMLGGAPNVMVPLVLHAGRLVSAQEMRRAFTIREAPEPARNATTDHAAYIPKAPAWRPAPGATAETLAALIAVLDEFPPGMMVSTPSALRYASERPPTEATARALIAELLTLRLESREPEDADRDATPGTVGSAAGEGEEAGREPAPSPAPSEDPTVVAARTIVTAIGESFS